jgi:hypothetical protein
VSVLAPQAYAPAARRTETTRESALLYGVRWVIGNLFCLS